MSNKNIFVDEEIKPRSLRFAQLSYDGARTEKKVREQLQLFGAEGLTFEAMAGLALQDLLKAFSVRYKFFEAKVNVVWIPAEAAGRLPEPVSYIIAQGRNLSPIDSVLKSVTEKIDFEIAAFPSLKEFQLPNENSIGMELGKYRIDNRTMDRALFIEALSARWNVPFEVGAQVLQCIYIYDPETVTEQELEDRIEKTRKQLARDRESLPADVNQIGVLGG